ncbi:MAG: 30S ribosomal protein S4 [Candidatus Pacebacteria bacterium]|nr:30S ribosomal protein S4 [Candidatus Paceibacterota bacterium]
MSESKCKICRRQGVKLLIRGEKCLSPKCPMVRKPYVPGPRVKRRKNVSEYAKELKEKQKLKNWYNLSEGQFKTYVKKTLSMRSKVENAAEFLINTLEKRLDNVIYRLGFASSRAASRQLVTHCHFMVNGKYINIPSYSVKKGDKITLVPSSSKKNIFKNITAVLKRQTPPSWLKLNAEKVEAEVIGEPAFQEAAPPAEISVIFEFYSR